mmetsp:Transcript_33113/g.104776  ORF Transcript_33113/g.104776 Transcript_33113/m.104776 type:complete len:211 (+) Transcript_33113:2278-2910(+)
MERRDDVHHGHEVLHGLRRLRLGAVGVLLADLAGQRAHVLVAPGPEVRLVALELVLEAVAAALLRHGHGQTAEDVGEEALLLPRAPRRVQLLERLVVRPQELERLRHRRHGRRRAADLRAQVLQRLHVQRRIVAEALNGEVKALLERAVLLRQVLLLRLREHRLQILLLRLRRRARRLRLPRLVVVHVGHFGMGLVCVCIPGSCELPRWG